MKRIWIYQSNREFYDNELTIIQAQLKTFTERWHSHNRKMNAEYEIRYNRFIILKADESNFEASGCSIDESNRFIKELENQFNLNLFDRTKMAYLENDTVKTCSISEIRPKVLAGEINSNTLVFNNLAANDSELESNWKIPFDQSGFSSFAS